ncbi:MAG: nucleotidyltransferase domain-containing protein [Parcubacteria group bacterium]
MEINKSEKRFRLSKEDFAKERIEGVRDTFQEVKKDYPEILSFCLFGSLVKGDTKLESDIDMAVFVDAEQLECRFGNIGRYAGKPVVKKTIDREKGAIVLDTEMRVDVVRPIRNAIREILKKRLGLIDNQVRDILIKPISEDIIDSHVEEMVRGIEKENNDPKKFETVYISRNLYEMFHLETGGGIRKYRKYLIDKLCAMGETGERVWGEIVSDTSSMEHSHPDNIRYPRTLEEVKKIYA